jgi:hypothetical protein
VTTARAPPPNSASQTAWPSVLTAAIYFADFGNNRVRRVSPTGAITTVAGTGNNRVRRVSPTVTITTIAGTGQGGFGGDNGPATAAGLSFPTGVAVAADGSILIADTGNNRVRRVSPTVTITTVAGTGQGGFGGDNGPATATQLSDPTGVAAAADGTIYLADTINNRVRQVTHCLVISTFAGVVAGVEDK